MKAVRVHEFGGPQVLKIETNVPIPVHTDSQVFFLMVFVYHIRTTYFLQVLIRVGSAGVNPVDTYIRMGLFTQLPITLPYIPGRDGSGTVEKVGSQVDTLKVSNQHPLSKVQRLSQPRRK